MGLPVGIHFLTFLVEVTGALSKTAQSPAWETHISSTATEEYVTEAVMQTIAQANIDKFNLLLKTETDPTKRAMILRLLAEEKEKFRFAIENKGLLRK